MNSWFVSIRKAGTYSLAVWCSIVVAGHSHAATYLIDVGRNNGSDGRITPGPDAHGNFWNNLDSPDQAISVANKTRSNLVSTENVASSIGVELVGEWQSNGRLNGGLISPNGPQRALLGDFAVETATEDYYFLTTSDSATGTVVLTGLDTGRTYRVDVFGSRSTAVETRITEFSHGLQSAALTTSGADIGSDGAYDGNDDTLASLVDLVPDSGGQLIIGVEVTSGDIGYINAMKIIENPQPLHGGLLLDLGRNNGTDGSATSSPDGNGHHWNNIESPTQATTGNRTVNDMVTVDNESTGIGVELVGQWQSNGRLNGGLFGTNGPSSSLLGDFAVETATEDYYFLSASDSATGTVVITGLDVARTYHILFFGSRNTAAETRVTTFSYGGRSAALITSGVGIGSNGSYAGNDNRVAGLYGLTPTSAGTLLVNVEITQGQFGYINAMKIQPNPVTRESSILVDFGPAGGRHSLGVPDANGNWWNYVTSGSASLDALTNAANIATGISLSMSGWGGVNGDPGANWAIVEAEVDPTVNRGRFGFFDVVKNGAFFADSATPTLTLSGLDDDKAYTLTFYGARGGANRTTTYAVGTNSVSLQTGTTTSWNTGTVVRLAGMKSSSGSMTVNVSATGGFGYLNALEIETSVSATLTNTVAMLGDDAITPLSGDASSGYLVQLIAVGSDGVISQASTVTPGEPGGDDQLVEASNNPTHVGAGLSTADIGQILQTMTYNESLAGSAVFIRYWNAETPTLTSLYGDSPVFYLPADGIPSQIQVDFLPTGSSPPTTVHYIPTMTVWGLLAVGVMIMFFGRRLLQRNAAA